MKIVNAVMLKDLWVPKEVADLWIQGGKLIIDYGGNYQYNLLDNLRSSVVDILMDPVNLAEKYSSYKAYRADLEKTATDLSKQKIDEIVQCAKGDKRLEVGRKMLKKGITTEKLNQVKALLEECLEV